MKNYYNLLVNQRSIEDKCVNSKKKDCQKNRPNDKPMTSSFFWRMNGGFICQEVKLVI